jgi:hypothetical protein
VYCGSESPTIHAWLASAYALNGESERVASQLAEARGLSRDGRYLSIARLKDVRFRGVPKLRASIEDNILVGLHKAGVPEE